MSPTSKRVLLKFGKETLMAFWSGIVVLAGIVVGANIIELFAKLFR